MDRRVEPDENLVGNHVRSPSRVLPLARQSSGEWGRGAAGVSCAAGSAVRAGSAFRARSAVRTQTVRGVVPRVIGTAAGRVDHQLGVGGTQ